MNELALFAGAGGGILGGKLLGWRTVCAVEINEYCRKVLMQRQADNSLTLFPIWDDVRTFDGRPWSGIVDVVSAGFPCQPFSVAGQRKGEADERNMWPDTIRILREVRPRFALLENVPGLISSGYLGTILGDLAESGFDARWRVLSAAEVGAPHKRDRLWILAYASGAGAWLEKYRSSRQRRENADSLQPEALRQEYKEVGTEGINASGNYVSDAESLQREAIKRSESDGVLPKVLPHNDSTGLAHVQGQCAAAWSCGGAESSPNDCDNGKNQQWSPEPAVGRVAHGVAHRVDRLKALGNGQVPLVAATAWCLLGGPVMDNT